MPSEANSAGTPSEKPHHYSYLKEFRTQQCPLFLQHKCTQHRPYTCFHWHFMNQRRRRPVRKRDGTYNYSPDVYCTKYDETTGICPEGDECPYLHRTAGDTERRYHLRYYKTCTCVYETDARGHCAKNGAHCAFAHGAQDLRPAIYDIRELQALELAEKSGAAALVSESPLGSSLEKDRIINEDPRWNDTNYVLTNYKTEHCKRPPRLCRQGYACPSYHNTRDRRRSPKKFKYRSTPCPNVKHGDDWGDPTQCENSDGCAYCHTRTEQQFHPEIYKSTKCNDMVQTGYCPRGPFCAFAHVENEMTSQRDVSSPGENSLAAYVANIFPDSGHHKSDSNGEHNNNNNSNDKADQQHHHHQHYKNGGDHNGKDSHSTSNGNGIASSLEFSVNLTNVSASYPEPIGKGRANSLSSSITSEGSLSSYHKAPGSEREDTHSKLRSQLQSIESDPLLDATEKSKRKHNLLLLHNLNVGSPGVSLSSSVGVSSPLAAAVGSPSVSAPMSAMSPLARSFYPAGETVESVIGNALDEDLNMGELGLTGLDRELSRDNDDTNSVCSSLSTGFTANSSTYLGASSVPVTIPQGGGGGYQRNSLGSLSQSPCSSPMGSLPLTFSVGGTGLQTPQQQRQEKQIHGAQAAFLSHPNPGKFSAPRFSGDFPSMSPHSDALSQSPLVGGSYGGGGSDLQRMRDELHSNKLKLQQWEEGIAQACEAWKREAEDASKKARSADEEKRLALKQRDDAMGQVAKLKAELDQIRAASLLGAAVSAGGSFLAGMPGGPQPDSMAHKQLQQLRKEFEKIELLKQQQTTVGVKCGLCQNKERPVRVLPCSHYVLCEGCTSKCNKCPMCHCPLSASGFVLPM